MSQVLIVDSKCGDCGESAFALDEGYAMLGLFPELPMEAEQARALVEHSTCLYCGGQPQIEVIPAPAGAADVGQEEA